MNILRSILIPNIYLHQWHFILSLIAAPIIIGKLNLPEFEANILTLIAYYYIFISVIRFIGPNKKIYLHLFYVILFFTIIISNSIITNWFLNLINTLVVIFIPAEFLFAKTYVSSFFKSSPKSEITLDNNNFVLLKDIYYLGNKKVNFNKHRVIAVSSNYLISIIDTQYSLDNARNNKNLKLFFTHNKVINSYNY